MNPDIVLFHLRRFLLALSGLLFAGTLIELSFINHAEEPVQLIPFALCGVGLFAVIASLLRPQRGTLIALRACMGLIAMGGFLGMYEHIENNVAFQLEIRPRSTTIETIAAALGGANPLLAPGILALAAVLAVAATYYHPALGNGTRRGMNAS
jgi:hypothetical protein